MTSLQNSLDTLGQLISYASVSSTSNAAVSQFVRECLQSLGFAVQRSQYLDADGVEKINLVARRDSTNKQSDQGGLAYFCHTDVVPAKGWTGPGGDPFTAVIQNDRMYGRGACDMKGSLAAMLSAVARVDPADQTAPLWIVCTADEEVGFEGAKYLVQHSTAYREIVAAQPLGIIGEPTSLGVVHAHKGIKGFEIISRGRAAHSSLADGVNANEALVPMLQTVLELGEKTKSDPRYHDHRFDPPTLSWNFGVRDSNSAINITSPRSSVWVTLRSMPEIDGEDLFAAAKAKAESLGLEFVRHEGGCPVWVNPNADAVQAMCELAGRAATTVCYGTDGGEFTELKQMVVCGPGDIAQAHTTDEYLAIEQLQNGIDLYRRAIRRWCC
ncbi:MAG: M20 family metallopeptidase [Pirellulaceae bacterium]|nr:M20 family metallopeptidase [Pirellulaceae bacterium]